ncbi:ABC transporter permease [Nocardioides aquiterrae]|uniref:FtsX-like permease family protein n=1 Tax=Nocardioides aquiterrae TaxID=203799 RepID=A0ABP4F5U3_9ACTN
MWRVSLRNLLAKKVRLALSAFAIVLGVAFVAGSFIFTDALGSAFDGIVGGTTADVEVMPKGAGEVDAFGVDARTIPASVADDLRQLPGAAKVAAVDNVLGVYVIGADGKLVGGNGPPGLAFNYTELTAITGDRILTLAEGRVPSAPGEIALDLETADKAGYAVGDEVTLVTPADPPTMQVRLVGLVRFGSEGGLVGATLTIFEREWLQELFFDGRDVYTNISMTAADGVSRAELRDAAAEVVPAGVEVKTGDAYAEETKSAIGEILGFVNTFLLVFAAVSMVVGTFLIVNTFSILVAQRSRELALLRALGASRWQVNLSVLLEAFVIGVFGATVGIGFGYLLAIGLKTLFGAVGLDLGQANMPLELRTVLVSYAVGVTVTLLAAYLPARRAGRVAPVEAMREDVSVPESAVHRRMLLGAVMALAGTGLMVLGILGEGSRGLLLIGLGMLVILVGVSLTAAVLGRPVIVGLGAVFRRTSGMVGTLAGQNSLRNPRRTAATASALMVGLTVVTLMSILGQSAKTSTDQAIEKNLSAQLVVSNVTGQFFSPQYAREIRKVDGVANVVAVRTASAKYRGSTVFLDAADPRLLGSAVRVPVIAGSLADLRDDTVLVRQSVAEDRGLAVGDDVTLTFPGGRRTYQVAGVFPTTGSATTDPFLTTLGGLRRAGFVPEDSVLFIVTEPAADQAAVRSAIDDILVDNPTVTLKDQQEFADEQKAQIDTFLYLIYALLGLAVVIAVLGITNTLALSVIERTREIGLLRAVGVSRRQLRTMIRLESVVIAVLGAVLGVVMGLVFGWVLQREVADDGIDVLAIPWVRLAVFMVLAALVGVLAAVFPARRAARLDVLRAIATE